MSAINPPEKITFVPQAQVEQVVDQIVEATLQALAVTPTPTVTQTLLPPGPTATATISPTPTLTPTSLPMQINLPGVKYETQRGRWNYCGPANLSMAMTFWGWNGNRDIVGQAVKPNEKDDKNVMPYEMENFVETNTADLAAVVRLGGNLPLVKRLIAAGFPVLVEKGYYETDADGHYSWLGHYQFVTGYDEGVQTVIVQDTYLDGPDFQIQEEEFIQGWRNFNFIFLVVYPRAREAEVLSLLGDWVDEAWSNRHAQEIAARETAELLGVDQYFAWYNLGSSYVSLQDYASAAQAYDQAFLAYALLPDDGLRPFRMVWYQTGPYFAYYYTARYQDVLSLANTTFDTIQNRLVLEESLYWRGMAKVALGDIAGAEFDFRKSLEVHPNFPPTLEAMRNLGLEP
jgi:tetratricopeptide (TPR) repeat protein